jgi:hypothetical protein
VKSYYDTGLLLKLYTNERNSEAVRNYVLRRREGLVFTPMHHAECVSALRLKCFRDEADEGEAWKRGRKDEAGRLRPET